MAATPSAVMDEASSSSSDDEAREVALAEDQGGELALLTCVDDQMTSMARSTVQFTDKMASGFVKFLFLYAVLCVHVVRTIGRVPSCSEAARRENRCAAPWLPVRGGVDVFVFSSLSGDPNESRGTAPIFASRNATTADMSFPVPIPEVVRTRGAPLVAHVFVAPARAGEGWDPLNDTTLAATAHCVGSLQLTRPARVASAREKPRKLLERPQRDADADHFVKGDMRPHWKFGSWPVVLRLLDVGGDGFLPSHVAYDGLPNLGVSLDAREERRPDGRRRLVYMPPSFLDETLVLERHAVPMSRNTSLPAPIAKFHVRLHGPLHFGLRATVAMQLLTMAAALLGASEVDELRWQLSDQRVFRYAVSQAIGVVHVALDYCAFSEDVGFYVGRETFAGVSPSTLIWALARDLILFLYLQDQAAGLLVLFGIFTSLIADFFKIQRVLRPRLVLRRFRKTSVLFYPALVTAQVPSPPAKATAEYDATATRHLYASMWPLLVGVALYTLAYDVHTSFDSGPRDGDSPSLHREWSGRTRSRTTESRMLREMIARPQKSQIERKRTEPWTSDIPSRGTGSIHGSSRPSRTSSTFSASS